MWKNLATLVAAAATAQNQKKSISSFSRMLTAPVTVAKWSLRKDKKWLQSVASECAQWVCLLNQINKYLGNTLLCPNVYDIIAYFLMYI
jgi:methionine synthase II (cobalamin-independent)